MAIKQLRCGYTRFFKAIGSSYASWPLAILMIDQDTITIKSFEIICINRNQVEEYKKLWFGFARSVRYTKAGEKESLWVGGIGVNSALDLWWNTPGAPVV